MVLKVILGWIGFTYLVWMPAVIWYKAKDKPELRTSVALNFAGYLILALAYGAWFLIDLPIIIPVIGIGVHLALRLVGGIMLRRSARNRDSESEGSPGDTLEL